jgi:hypothetical protein
MRIHGLIAMLIVVGAVFAVSAHGQTATTGQIVGLVTDPSGALVAGARVTLTSDAGVHREVMSGTNGRYTIPLLDPGNYRLEVDQSGFASAKLEGVVVRITETAVVDVALKVAGAPTTVSVTGESPLVQTESSGRGSVIDEQQIRDLPLPTNNFQQLLTLTAGTSGSLTNSSDLGRGDVEVNVNGQRALSNDLVINGIPRSIRSRNSSCRRACTTPRPAATPAATWRRSPSPGRTASMATCMSSSAIRHWTPTISF